jgi:predicted P-loop ATPase
MGYSKQAVLMMFREGSGFTSRLADLWLVADTKHRNQIENAFRDLFDQWEDRYERHLEIMVEAEANR